MVSEHRRRGFPEGWLADTFGAPLGKLLNLEVQEILCQSLTNLISAR